MIDLMPFCQRLAPDFNWAPVNAHMRNKFAALGSSTFEIRYQELLKFLYLRSRYGKGFIPVTVEIDEMWHEMILQTRTYHDLCMKLPGHHFIHHNNIGLDAYADLRSPETVIHDLLDWIPNYTDNFGPFEKHTAQYWMIINFLQEEMDYTLDRINQLQSHVPLS